jgi:hypothetical protein
MIYVTYGFASLFIVLASAMFFAYYRSSHFGLFIMGVTYAASGLLAFAIAHWWPLVAGFVLVWLLRLLGLEPRVEPKEEGAGEVAEPQSQSKDKN